jgi:arylsulfatase A-like enzyme
MKVLKIAIPIILLLSLVFIPGTTYGQDQQQPNIVLIFADDLGFGDVSFCGSEIISTPNIDALAKNGVRLTQGYVSHPVCSPSRAGLLTGRYQQRHGWEFNPMGRDVDLGMSVEERTFADELKAAGYATGMVGKWHLGYQKPHHPMSRGFDEYFGVLAGGSIFIDPATEGVESVGRQSATRGSRNGVYRGFEEVTVERYLTDVFTDEAVDFIDRHQEKPFFLYLSHTTPHTPLQATQQHLKKYSHIEDKGQRVYAAMVEALDDSVRRVVEKLKATNEYENTMIVFLSDNGCAGYVNGACSNGPFAGFKRYHQEGGIHIPFVVSWPEALPSGTTFDHPVISLDLLATFTAAAGKPVTTEDSVDLLPFLLGQNKRAPHEYLRWRAGPTKAIRGARWKMIKYNKTDFRPEDLSASGGRLNPPKEGWSTDSPLGQVTLLYDMHADPGETTNLADGNEDIVEKLTLEYDAWEKTLRKEALLPPMRSTIANMHGEWVQLFF